jgi:hypothetical protein
LPIFFGIIGIIPILNYLIRGKYDESPGLIMGCLLTCITLIVIGTKNTLKIKRKKTIYEEKT